MSAVTPEAVDAAAKVLMRGGTVQDMLEAAAPLIVAAALGDGDGDEGTARIRAAERARCATALAHVSPLDFLRAHGLEPGAGTGRVLVAAAAHILAPGGDGPGRAPEAPQAAAEGPAGVVARAEP